MDGKEERERGRKREIRGATEEEWEEDWFTVIRLQRQVLRQGNYFTACATVIISPLCMLRMVLILLSEPQLKQITHVLTDRTAQNEFRREQNCNCTDLLFPNF